MRLADFLTLREEEILVEAASFAKTLPVLQDASDETLRDHFSQCLEVIAQDLRQSQSRTEAIDKSRGNGLRMHDRTAADEHGIARANSGLTTSELVSEFRALRASVVRLWTDEQPPSPHTIEDLIRFNEAVDQTLAESVTKFEEQVEHWRHIFLGVVGHDLRTPLNAVALTTDLLKRQVDSKIKPRVEIIAKGVKRIGGMLDSLLDYSNSQVGSEMTLTREKADLCQACEEEIEILNAAFPDANIQLKCEKNLLGNFNVSRLREALSNLVANAAQHGGKKFVHVTVERRDNVFAIRVQNDGAIEPEQLANIFEPLKRGIGYQSGHRTNLGLGLFICKQITSAHGGKIEINSESGIVTISLEIPVDG